MNNLTKPLVSVIIPAYNESSIIEKSVNEVYNHIQELNEYDWEIIVVNDGSKDDTGPIADSMRQKVPVLKVFHHIVNLNIGNALITGIKNSSGNYIITLDVDLSYGVSHIDALLKTITQCHADMVLASPYMKGGRVTAVPFMRRKMSRYINWLMSISSQEKYHTFTCMVRAYKGDFIRSMNLKTTDYEIFPEIVYKAMILRARIIEIPAHLDWTNQNELADKRKSGMRVLKTIFHGLMASFIFRPYVYFISGGILTLFIALLIVIIFGSSSNTLLVMGFLAIIAVQLVIQGLSSLQAKRYYEEIYHFNSTIYKKIKTN